MSPSRGGKPIYAPTKGAFLVGKSINAQGNELAFERREPGRVFETVKGADRPAGRSTARWVSGVNELDSVTGDVYLPRP
ncbi:MAG: hypothetical protein JWL73_1123 [Actinomycetia bacterium]|nr:hypothetical protein [Actinomycetes bacterium]